MHWPIVAITGSHDEATAIAVRLFRAGFNVFLVVRQNVVDLHFHRTFSRALYAGQGRVEGVSAITRSQALQQNLISPQQDTLDFVHVVLNNRQIPLVSLEDLKRGQVLPADYLVALDAQLADDFLPFFTDELRTIGFEQSSDKIWVCKEGPLAGQVFYPFSEEKEFPPENLQRQTQRVIEAPLEGVFVASKQINEKVFEKEEVGKLNEIPILSPYSGVVSGILNSGALIQAHTPIVEITVSKTPINARYLPMQAFALAGGVLEAILFDWKNRTT